MNESRRIDACAYALYDEVTLYREGLGAREASDRPCRARDYGRRARAGLLEEYELLTGLIGPERRDGTR